MNNKELFYKIADENFNLFMICTEDDIDTLRNNKQFLRQNIRKLLCINEDKLDDVTLVEIFNHLLEFSFRNNLTNLEICTTLKLFWETLNLLTYRRPKNEVFDFFNLNLMKYAMDRFYYKLGVFKKETVYALIEYFIETIYKRYELLLYTMTTRVNLEILNKDMFDLKLPRIALLDSGIETIPRNLKILKQYSESRRPKTELEQKIETILEFERDMLDKMMEDKFIKQDEVFNKKVEELFTKKKR